MKKINIYLQKLGGVIAILMMFFPFVIIELSSKYFKNGDFVFFLVCSIL